MSEDQEKPEKTARPGTFCHSCGERGHIFEIPEVVQMSQGDLDLPLFRCENCGAKWYDASDVIPIVVIYRLELGKEENRGPS